MKTLKMKRMMSIMAMMSVAMIALAGNPQKLYNDKVVEGRVTLREVCCKTDNGYERFVRSELGYLANGVLESKNVYRWDAVSRCWRLSKSYFYTSPSDVELITYDKDGKTVMTYSNKHKSL